MSFVRTEDKSQSKFIGSEKPPHSVQLTHRGEQNLLNQLRRGVEFGHRLPV